MKIRTEEELYVETKYEILYEDEFFLVVDKPAPLPVHPVGRFREKNLLSLLKKERGEAALGFRIVNRLDSETSGLVVIAKSGETAGRLGIIFENRRVLKEYHAVVFGHPHLTPPPSRGRKKEGVEGTISIPLGTRVRNSHRVRVPDDEGQIAITRYQTVKSFGEYSLLRVLPQTGRTHQIRAHLSFLGHPIVGDKIYINPEIFERYIHEGWQEDMRGVVKAERLLLHATGLAFEHPFAREPLQFRSALPPCFASFVEIGD